MKKLTNELQVQFNKMQATGKLFRVAISGQNVWDMYLSSFIDEITFRDPESSEHNCNFCKNFIRRYGNIVAIDDDGELMSLFTNLNALNFDEDYLPSIEACDDLITNSKIVDVFFETYTSLNECNYEKTDKKSKTFKLGNASNTKRYTLAEAHQFKRFSAEEAAEMITIPAEKLAKWKLKHGEFIVRPNEERRFNHFHLILNKEFVDFSGKSINNIQGEYRTKAQVFMRTILEIPLGTLELVRDLMNQGSLLNGAAHVHSVEEMIKQVKVFNPEGKLSLDDIEAIENLNTMCWYITYSMSDVAAKFKNHMPGKLCTDLVGGMDLNKACESWNKLIDPANYKKAKAPITQKQINEAQKFVEENGYEGSFSERRFALIRDISVDEIRHINENEEVKKISMFDNVKSTKTSNKKPDFSKVEEVTIEKFMKDILPNCESVEAYLENNMDGNLVTMTYADPSLKNIFKWNNPYSWTYNGNLAGKSFIKDAVKAEGGIVDADVRVSLMWAEGDVGGDNSDLDIHLHTPEGHIYYGNCALPDKTNAGGNLDLDITNPQRQRNWKNVAENITYPDITKMPDGEYTAVAHNYHNRGNKYFDAEIEILGDVFNYHNPTKLTSPKKIATFHIKAGQLDSIKHHMSETNQSKELWGLDTKKFHKVNLVCLSPNHWGDNAVGNKHYMFMLEGCKSDTSIRTFHIENLNEELTAHRKVLEVLGASAMIEPEEEQLAGLGFNATVRDELIVKCKGSFNRMLKIKF